MLVLLTPHDKTREIETAIRSGTKLRMKLNKCQSATHRLTRTTLYTQGNKVTCCYKLSQGKIRKPHSSSTM